MNILVTGAFQLTPDELAQLECAGHNVTIHLDEHTAVKGAERYEAVVCNGLFLYNKIEQFTSLRLIQLTSAGLDRIPLEYIQSHGIMLHNAAGVYSVPMAEWTIMRILELYKNGSHMYANQTARLWEKDRNWQELTGKTACIIGFGTYGQETAKRLKAFGMNIIVINRTKKTSPWVDQFYPIVKLKECLPQADLVILAIALTSETYHLINRTTLWTMKKNSFLINAARGALVDEPMLVEALRSGRIKGAALDVFETEPLPQDSPLWTLDNVLLSPHNSFVADKIRMRLGQVILYNLLCARSVE